MVDGGGGFMGDVGSVAKFLAPINQTRGPTVAAAIDYGIQYGDLATHVYIGLVARLYM